MAVDFQTLQSLGLTEKQGASTKSRNELNQDDFLKLMTAQLNHQDPMKPQDSTEFLTQMAQFGTVNGIQGLQKTMTDFTEATQKNQALTAANLVGRSVMIASDKGAFTGSANLQGELVLPADASDINLQITDSSGRVVFAKELGAQAAGNLPFAWNGTTLDGGQAPAGMYKITANAVSNGQTSALVTHVAAQVQSVTLNGAKGMEVQVQGQGSHGLSDILAVL